jgi:Lon protease-like protein
MAIVRSLQMSYYSPSSSSISPVSSSSDDDDDQQNQQTKRLSDESSSQESNESSSDDSRCRLDESTGQLYQLPLFRAPWWEVPGRSNVLTIHEPIYTNMLEKILYGPKPWIFGHLYLEDGIRSMQKSSDAKFDLQTWETATSFSQELEASAVVGCLMNISDYRRLADGRLLVLVHAMERFVVQEIQQALPYSIVTAQLLPDAEEMDPTCAGGGSSNNGELIGRHYYFEQDLATSRAWAVQESVRYHDYEYDCEHVLPVPDNKPENLQVSDVLGSHIAKVLPYIPFSKTLEPPTPNDPPSIVPTSASSSASARSTNIKNENEENVTTNSTLLFSLEYRLLCQGVYQTPLTDPDFPERQHLSADELEYELWLAINNFLIQTRTPVSPVLLGLLPLHLDIDWPTSIPTLPTQRRASLSLTTAYNTTRTTTATRTEAAIPSYPFALKQIVSELASLSSASASAPSSSPDSTAGAVVDHDFVQVSPDYPAHRRQRRLSYSAALLLEATSDMANELRPRLLATPTTQQRLRMVLQQFDQWQEANLGEFQ